MHLSNKLKFSIKKIHYWIYMIITIIGFLIFYALYDFLDKNFYKIISGESGYLLIQESQTDKSRINMNSFNSVIEKINKKTEKRKVETIKNIF